MRSINEILKKIENTNSEDAVIGTEKLVQALQAIGPGFQKMKLMVDKSREKILLENDPEKAKILNAVFKAENNDTRLNVLQTRFENLNEGYQKHVDLLQSKGLGFIIQLKPEEMSVVAQRIIENKEIKNSINENLKEFGMTFDDLPKMAKEAIIDKEPKKRTMKYT